MERLDFYKLARPVQERFIGSLNGTGLPAPILDWRTAPAEPRLWLAMGVGGTLAIAALARIGFGSLASGMAIQSPVLAAIYVGLGGVAVFGYLRAMKIRGEIRALPFKPGVYVFPVGLIDARRQWLRVYKIDELQNVTGPDPSHAFRVVFGGTTYTFTARDAAHASNAEAALGSARDVVRQADTARDTIRPKALAALDPLHGVANPLVSSQPITRTPPAWAKFDWMFALVLGVIAGLSVFALRNAKSDDAMYTAALTAADAPSFRAYLDHASRHREEISNVLLPRVELLDAEKAGTVDAIERYIHDHPTTGIPNEVAAALRKAMLAELEKAKQAGTLAALDDFAKRHPDAHLDSDLRTARHAVYQAALERYKASAPVKGDAVAFVERLLAYAEKKGPAVEVRFHRQQPKSIDKADGQVAKNRFFNGVVSLPSRYFDVAHARPRETTLGTAIQSRFAEAFPPEILAFTVGAPIDDPEAALPAATVPTLFVEHAADWTGGQATSSSPRGVFIGLGFNFHASFTLPDDPKPRAYKTTIYKIPNPADGKGDDKPEEKIYDAMADDTYVQFGKRFLATFFKP
jgi:hypothetical protein